MSKQHHERFKDAPWYPLALSTTILLGGAGGIGSWVAFLLARAGFRVMVYDHDTVEEINIGGQFYSVQDTGKTKVEALRNNILNLTGDIITIANEKVDEKTVTHDFVITAFDNMKARKDMFEKWAANAGYGGIFIDGRLNAEQMWIYCVRNNSLDKKSYAGLLFDDSEIEEAPCTMKQTTHSAVMIASHIVAFLTNHITNITNGDMDRTVPFSWEYIIPINLVTEEEYYETITTTTRKEGDNDTINNKDTET